MSKSVKLRSLKARKDAILKFNTKPKLAVEYLVEHAGMERSAGEFAQWLYEYIESLSKKKLGEFLGGSQQWNGDCLVMFLQFHDFAQLSLSDALRQLLLTFRLPGEAQVIDRILERWVCEHMRGRAHGRGSTWAGEHMCVRAHARPSTWAAEHVCDAGRRGGSGGLPPTSPEQGGEGCRALVRTSLPSPPPLARPLPLERAKHEVAPARAHSRPSLARRFSSRYHECNPDKFRTKDCAYILAFSIIMLNTDLHSRNIPEHKKMKLDEFVRNNRGIDEGQDPPREMLEAIYMDIKGDEILMKESDM
jgi:hypothetical protein